MVRARRTRRLVVVVVALVVGLLGMEPAWAEPASAVQRSERAELPGVSSPPVEVVEPSLPERTAVVPEAWDPSMPRVADRSVDEVPDGGTELVGRRDQRTEVFANGDGTETVKVHSQPVHYLPDGSAAWQEIDNTLVVDETRPGWVRNAGNDWTVRFGPIVAGGGGGMELVTDAGVTRSAPERDAGAAPVSPVVGSGEAADSVVYRDVWPGVDVRYTVSNARVKEEIVVEEGSRAEFPFVVEGLGLVEAAPSTARGTATIELGVPPDEVGTTRDTAEVEASESAVPAMPEVTGSLAEVVSLEPLSVLDASGDPTAESGVRTRVEPFAPAAGASAAAETVDAAEAARVADAVAPVTADAQRLVVSVDAGWLEGQAEGEQPVVIDPTTVLNTPSALCQYDVIGTGGDCAGVSTGTSSPGYGNWRRGVAQFPYQGHVQWSDVLYAGIWMNQSGPSVADAELINVWEATQWSAVGAVANGDPAYWIDSGVVQDGGCGAFGDVCLDVTEKVRQWQMRGVFQGWWDGKFGFSPDEGDWDGNNEVDVSEYYSLKSFSSSDVALVMNTNARVPGATLSSPADGALAVGTTAPVLRWQPVLDPDGDPIKYTVKIATGADGESGAVAASAELTSTSWTVPDGVLRDGVTYYWKVFASDGQSWTPSSVWKLTVDRRQGLGGMSPGDDFAGVSTNLVTGAPNLAIPGRTMPTVGGGIDVAFAYDGRPALTGLVGTYREDDDKDHNIDPEDDIKLVRTDPQISFNWSNDPYSPSPAVPTDGFQVSWRGTIRTPAGQWQLGAWSDDGVKVWIDDQVVLDSWSGSTPPSFYQTGSFTGQHKIRVDYYESTGPAHLSLWARPTSNPSAAGIVPSDWLAPESPDMAQGWTLRAADVNAYYTHAYVTEASIALTGIDGATYSFTKTPNGTYKPPAGVEDLVVLTPQDSKVVVHDDAGYTYTFRPDGGLESVVSAVDDLHPATARSEYDSAGRLTKLIDPVSMSGTSLSTGRGVTFRYAASDGDTSCPNVPSGKSATDFQAEEGLLCQVSYWDGTTTELFYKIDTDRLMYISNPGGVWWSFSYDTLGRLAEVIDPLARDALAVGDRPDGASDSQRIATKIAYDTANPSVDARVATVTAPAALPAETDTLRAQHGYTYSPSITDGILQGGTAQVTRAGAPGVNHRSVTYDYRGRSTAETNATGQTIRTYWDIRDLQVATVTADGIMTATEYNGRNQPTTVWGPAPESQFHWVQFGTSAYPKPRPEYAAQIPTATTRYDEGPDFAGLQARWWQGTTIGGRPIAHVTDTAPIRDDPGAARPTDVPADNVAARYTGDINLATQGLYKFQICVGVNDLAVVYIDGVQKAWAWSSTTTDACSDIADVGAHLTTLWPNHTARVQIDYYDFGGSDRLHFNYTDPTGAHVAAAGLSTGYSLPTTTIDPDGRTTTTAYSDATADIGPQHGLVTSTTVDPAGLALKETTTYEPVGTGYLRRRTRTLPGGSGTTTQNSWYKGRSEPGNTLDETADDPCTTGSGEVEAIFQGGMLRTDTAADPDAAGSQSALVRHYVYDNAGRQRATRIGDDGWTCTTYDARGRTTQVAYPALDGQPARTVNTNYAVDPDGSGTRGESPLVTTVTDPAGTITTEVDLLGRPIRYVDVWGNTTTFTYDQLGRETANTGPAGNIVKTYDNADRVASVSRNTQTLATPAYDSATGRLTGVTYPSGTGNGGNNTEGVFTYSPDRGQLASVTWRQTGSPVITSDTITSRTPGGDIVSHTIDGTATNTYSYDNAGRLTQAIQPSRTTQYGFGTTTGCSSPTNVDAGRNTNRTSQTIVGGATTTYCYDNADRLTSTTQAGVGTIAYDGHGNTTSMFGETHTYDAADRHMTTTKGTTTVSYVRDATDRIVARKVGTTTVARYGTTGSGDAPDITMNATGQVVEVTLSLPGGVLLTTRSAGNVWSYPNTHGDIAATANQTGVKQGATRLYDPYGNTITGGDVPDNSAGNLDYGWLGQHQRPLEHEPNLQPIIEMGARQYSPLLGRFLEVDPVEGGSANDYDYTAGDPVNLNDLGGECLGCIHRNRSRSGRGRQQNSQVQRDPRCGSGYQSGGCPHRNRVISRPRNRCPGGVQAIGSCIGRRRNPDFGRGNIQSECDYVAAGTAGIGVAASWKRLSGWIAKRVGSRAVPVAGQAALIVDVVCVLDWTQHR